MVWGVMRGLEKIIVFAKSLEGRLNTPEKRPRPRGHWIVLAISRGTVRRRL